VSTDGTRWLRGSRTMRGRGRWRPQISRTRKRRRAASKDATLIFVDVRTRRVSGVPCARARRAAARAPAPEHRWSFMGRPFVGGGPDAGDCGTFQAVTALVAGVYVLLLARLVRRGRRGFPDHIFAPARTVLSRALAKHGRVVTLALSARIGRHVPPQGHSHGWREMFRSWGSAATVVTGVNAQPLHLDIWYDGRAHPGPSRALVRAPESHVGRYPYVRRLRNVGGLGQSA